ncbi:unnamed protein product [Darwinula stevensoni]|uniref:Sulfatase N-terminal domain-containing protein n=1 Tax=Darwinula stevensoni TaxID=69355 RepID=A0A7R8X3Q8_9CRUS|nr:unnamed protein product [Darwinula stevensoni]CAG0882631.1 unnamed protein product [Darwinula stevensoni]
MVNVVQQRNRMAIKCPGVRVLACLLIVSSVVLSLGVYNGVLYPSEKIAQEKKPNFIIFLTDDQDLVLNSMNAMPKLKNLIGDYGITAKNMFATTPICCPSRASIFTGLYMHNHHTYNNTMEGGCNSVEWRRKKEPRGFPAIFKEHGYNTFYAGKYLNMYGKKKGGGVKHIPFGWDWWIGLVGNSAYYNYFLSVNGTKIPHGQNPSIDYLPHVLEKHWLLRQEPNPLPMDAIAGVDEVFRNRLRTLQTVDDIVANLHGLLKDKNLLDETYLIFTSDHGYHTGMFSQPIDKRQPYEFDIRVPLLVSGPMIPKQKVLDDVVLNIDLAPTLLEMAKIPKPDDLIMDGQSFAHLLFQKTSDEQIPHDFRDDFLIEYSGQGGEVGSKTCPISQDPNVSQCLEKFYCKCQDARNNTYMCLRQLNSKLNTKFCIFLDDEVNLVSRPHFLNFIEHYDLSKDPYELHNLNEVLAESERTELRSRVLELSRCSGLSCV